MGKCVKQMSHLWLSTYSLPFIHLWVFDLITDVEKKKLHLARTANCTRLLLIEVTATLTRPQERARRAGSMLGFCSNKGGDYAFSPVTGFQLHSFSLLARSIFFFNGVKKKKERKKGSLLQVIKYWEYSSLSYKQKFDQFRVGIKMLHKRFTRWGRWRFEFLIINKSFTVFDRKDCYLMFLTIIFQTGTWINRKEQRTQICSYEHNIWQKYLLKKRWYLQ